MRVVGTTTSGISAIECQYCGLVCEAFKSLEGKQHLVDLCNCGQCGKNSRGDIDNFDLASFRQSQTEGEPK